MFNYEKVPKRKFYVAYAFRHQTAVLYKYGLATNMRFIDL